MTQHEAIELQTRYGTVSGLAYGPKNGIPTLALHGWQDNGGSFSKLAPLLEGMRIVVVDLPGHGLSTWKPSGVPYVFFDWVLDGFDIANALNWDRFQLLGHSMGAGISSLMAGTLPERISRMVLIEGLGPQSAPSSDAPNLLKHSAQELQKECMPIRSADSFEEALSRRQGATQFLLEESVRTLLGRGLREESGGFSFRQDPRLRHRSPFRYTEEQVLAFLEEIRCPTLLIQAEDGWPFPEEIFTRRFDSVSEINRVIVPGNHHVHLDAPLQVLPAIQEFLGPQR